MHYSIELNLIIHDYFAFVNSVCNIFAENTWYIGFFLALCGDLWYNDIGSWGGCPTYCDVSELFCSQTPMRFVTRSPRLCGIISIRQIYINLPHKRRKYEILSLIRSASW